MTRIKHPTLQSDKTDAIVGRWAALVSGEWAGWTVKSMAKVGCVTNASLEVDYKSHADLLAVFIFKIGPQIAFLHIKMNFKCK